MARSNSGFWADFQKFIMQGNVIDLAVAVIIGAAFGKIVDSLVKDILTPAILQPVLQQLNLQNLEELSYYGIKYGLFLSNVISFLVIALSIFVIIRAFEKAQRKISRQEAIAEVPIEPTEAEKLMESQGRLTASIERLTQAVSSKTP
ncbi:large conductance mechanosensitive channel protein MscL [Pantanalinema sp. GBBB05]|uniref:large conductance mechanosensitive channel protein MscL n=1 Tax=Pantanalinema sp. GBBB05 TaxID=2604139 RepID=UPI001D3DD4AE|nr:large conductance mechanosensitive channel protein MscL [Pantanalinema sp. GBBB05]